MINVLIVDDEYSIREGIKNNISWAEYGLRVCGTAASGFEALELVDKEMPEIIILDIRLSDMDGLEVLEVVKEKYPHIKVILISGHDDFEYAQKAIELDAFSYILKPIDDKKLLAKIIDAKKIIEDQFNKIKSDENLNKQLKKNIPILKDIFLNQIVTGKLTDLQTMKERSEFLGIELSMSQYTVLVLELQDDNLVSKRSEYDKNMLKLAVINHLESMLGKTFSHYSFNLVNNIGVIIQGDNIDRTLLKNTCVEFKDYVNKSMGLLITIGLGRIHEGIHGIPFAFREALDALEYKLLLGCNVVIDIENIQVSQVNEKTVFAEDVFEDTIKKLEDDLIYSLKTLNRKKVAQITDNIVATLGETLRINIEKTDRLIFLMSFFLTKLLLTLDIKIEKFFDQGNEIYDDLRNLETIDQFGEYINRFFDKVMNILQNKQESKNSFLVSKAIEYIKENIYNDISLTKTADAIYISPNYLSRIFKQEMNETFIEFVTNSKMTEAKELLKNTNYKIYEIADMLKYKDVNHFTRVFKRVFSVTPTDYRELTN